MKLKNILRAQILKTREGLNEATCINSSRVIEREVQELIESVAPNNKEIIIGLYYPIKGEPDLLRLVKRAGWKVAIPKLCGTKMEFIKHDENAGFEKSEFGELMQPQNNDVVFPNIVVLPGIGFSIDGYRLGFGSGHYDRYFDKVDSAQNIIKIGVCFHENLYETLPKESHDVQSNYIITNKIKIAL